MTCSMHRHHFQRALLFCSQTFYQNFRMLKRYVHKVSERRATTVVGKLKKAVSDKEQKAGNGGSA